MPRSSDARDRFIETAARLFQQKGYHGVGLTELIDAAKAPKGSFYYHFPGGKEELAQAATIHAGKFISRRLATTLDDAQTLQQAAHLLLDAIALWFEQSEWSLGCPVTTIALELTPENDDVRQTVQAVFDDWIESIAGHADRLGADEPHLWARCLLTQIEGAWIMARVRQTDEPFEQIKAMY